MEFLSLQKYLAERQTGGAIQEAKWKLLHPLQCTGILRIFFSGLKLQVETGKPLRPKFFQSDMGTSAVVRVIEQCCFNSAPDPFHGQTVNLILKPPIESKTYHKVVSRSTSRLVTPRVSNMGRTFFLGTILFCLSRQKAEIFSIILIQDFVKPHKISAHSDNFYF